MQSRGAEIRVLLADEQALFRGALRMVLAGNPELEVVAEAGDGRSALAEALQHQPDVALISTGLSDPGGLATTRKIVEHAPECRVLVLAADDNPATLLDAIEAGASGFLSKESPVADLVDAVRTVHRNGILVPPAMLPDLIRGLVGRRRDRDDLAQRYSKLTQREREVLRLLVQGEDNEAIGRALVISPQTARTHVQNILAKLRLHSRLEAAAFAREIFSRDVVGAGGPSGEPGG